MRPPLLPETRAIRTATFTVTALMVAVAIAATAAALAMRHAEQTWRQDIVGRWTVEIDPIRMDLPVSQAQIGRAVAALRSVPGIADVRPLQPDELRALLEPWLKDAGELGDLPLPVLIDVRLDPAAHPDPAETSRRLGAENLGGKLDDHSNWLRGLTKLAETAEAAGAAMLGIGALTIALTVATAARGRVALNRAEIDLLHEIGATDGYISRQFALDTMRLSIAGAALGVALAGLMCLVLLHAGHAFAALAPKLSLTREDAACLAAVPLALVALATVAASATTRALLRRLL